MAEAGETGEAASGDVKLERTPTWIVASVCFVIVLVSLIVERLLHHLGKVLKRKNQKPLFDALQKVKEGAFSLPFPPFSPDRLVFCVLSFLKTESWVFLEEAELMLLGFISLLLTVLQGAIQKICIPEEWNHRMLPCEMEDSSDSHGTSHFQTVFSAGDFGGRRRLLSGDESGILLIPGVASEKVMHVDQFQFIRDRFKGIGAVSVIISWLHSFVKQFYGSVTKSDYTTMRLGFIMTHCKANPKFDFHKYMIRTLEADFKKVVGISWYLWVFVIIFLLLNINGLDTIFKIVQIYVGIFLRIFAAQNSKLLLAIGTKLEHVITQLAHDVAEKHSAIQGDLVVQPSNDHFWFHRPRIVLYMIHFILFQNAFEIAFFFWIFTTYGFNSCILDQVGFIVPRLIIGVIIQLLCSYSTLPLYAIVTQMGSYFKKAIFYEHVQEGLLGWARMVKKRKAGKPGNILAKTNRSEDESSRLVKMQSQDGQKTEADIEEG
ncbi:hypothetical protein ZIOFF_045326 [Zingiber officinale]|uniref:MLO-like protein n=1 Tax=Zingiber officinale TaxID=94328 RepID=A0A8J5KY58_ZINOF|nr:hypothetical protein ZIOFF_045326 [Zingiber officinale]